MDEVIDIATDTRIGVLGAEDGCVAYEVGVVGGTKENRAEVDGLDERQDASIERGG